MDAALAEIEALEATARRSDPRCGEILAEVKRRTVALAAHAEEEPTRIALLADAVRLADSGAPGRETEALAEAIPRQHAIVLWVEACAPQDAWQTWLARANLVDVMEQTRLSRLGMPPPRPEEEEAIQRAADAARALGDPYARLLSLHRLAATLWQRDRFDALEPVLGELAPLEPHAWRQALGRAHLAIARGRASEAHAALEATRRAKPPKELRDYLARLEASLASARSADLAPTRALLSWEHPPFVMSDSPRYELAVTLWRALPRGDRHARFVAERLRELDPRAEWTHWQAEKLGVPASRTHEALLAEVLAPRARRVRHARWGEGEVLREADGKLEVEFAAGRKVLLATALEPVD